MHLSKFSSTLILLLAILQTQAGYAGSELGRLFTSPEQRVLLNQLRLTEPRKTPQQNKPGKNFDINTSALEQIEGLNQTVRLEGLVIRHDGKTAVWKNKNFLFNDKKNNKVRDSVAIHSSPGKINVKSGGKEKIFKPGQTWFIQRDKVIEHYDEKIADQGNKKNNTQATGTEPVDTSQPTNPIETIKDYRQKVEEFNQQARNP